MIKKIVFRSLCVMMGLIILFSMLLSLAVNTKWVTNKLLDSCRKNFSEFSYSSVEGKISGGLTILNLHIKTKDFVLHIDQLTLKTRLKNLHITTDQLLAKGVHLQFNPHLGVGSQPTSKAFIPPLAFENIQLQDVTVDFLHTAKIHFDEIRARAYFLRNNYQITVRDSLSKSFIDYKSTAKHDELKADINFNKTKIHLLGDGDRKLMTIAGDIADLHQGVAKLQGNIHWQHQPLWQMVGSANKLHLDDLFPNYWPGYLSFEFTGSNFPDVNKISINHIAGMIGEQEISANTDLTLSSDGVSSIYSQLKTTSATLNVSGKLQPTYDLSWHIDVADLNKFIPTTCGSIHTRGALKGKNATKQIIGRLDLSNLNYLGFRVKKLVTNFNINFAKAHHGFINIAAESIKLHKLAFDKLGVNMQGELGKHDIIASLDSKHQQFAILLSGGWEEKVWRSTINTMTMKMPQQNYYLPHSATLELSPDRWVVNNLCVMSKQDKSQLCMNVQGTKHKQLSGTLTAHALDLAIINLFLPEDYYLSGKINLAMHAQQFNQNSFQRNLQADVSAGSFSYSSNNTVQKWLYQKGQVNAHWNEKNLRADVNMVLLPEGNLHAEFQFPKFSGRNLQSQEMHGKLAWRTTSLSYIESIIPAIKNVKGILDTKLNFSGNIKNPLLNINATLSDGSFNIPYLQLKPKQIKISAIGNQQLLTYQASLQSGTGQLTAHGKTNMSTGNIQTQLHLAGKDVLISNQPGIKISADPHMNLTIIKDEIKVNGDIHIPSASLQPNDLANTETVSDDVIYVKDKGKTDQHTVLKLHSNIKITLGDKIYLNYRGIKGQITGNLTVVDNPNSTTTATGQLSIQNGTYTLRNKTLQIDYGKLNFSGGPINNPFLNIRASRSLQNLNSTLLQPQVERVGVSILGSLKQPKIELFSEPPGKSQADILSYLVLGVPAQDAGGANAELLLQAADTLNLGGTSKIMNLKSQLQKSLGLSEMDIGTASEVDAKTQKTTTHTSFMLGKYFSPKFYVNYSFDLSSYTNTLKVRYLLNKYWILQSMTNSKGSGLDVLYIKEKD